MFTRGDVKLVGSDSAVLYLKVALPDGRVGHRRVELTAATPDALVQGTLGQINTRIESLGMDAVVEELAATDPSAAT